MPKENENQMPAAADNDILKAIGAAAPANEPKQNDLTEKEKKEKLAALASPPPESPAPEKNKGGRPPGSKTKPKTAAPAVAPAPPPPTPVQMQPEKLAVLSGALVDLLTARLPNPLPASAIEKEMFNQAFTEVANEYLPVLGQYGSLLSFVSVLGIIVIPRLSKPETKKETPAGASGGN